MSKRLLLYPELGTADGGCTIDAQIRSAARAGEQRLAQ